MNPPAKISAMLCSETLVGRGCEGGKPLLLPHLPGKWAGKEKLQRSEIVSGQLRVWMEQPLEADTVRRAQATPVPWGEVHGEVGHTPLGRGSCFEGRRKGHGRGGQGCTVGPANRNPLYKQGEDPTEIRDGFSFKKIKHLKHLRTHALTPRTVINFFLCRAWSTFQKQSWMDYFSKEMLLKGSSVMS